MIFDQVLDRARYCANIGWQRLLRLFNEAFDQLRRVQKSGVTLISHTVHSDCCGLAVDLTVEISFFLHNSFTIYFKRTLIKILIDGHLSPKVEIAGVKHLILEQ